MRKLAVLLPVLLAVFASLPSAAPAQELVCNLLPGAREGSLEGETYYISGPARFRCADGTYVEADSAIGYGQRGEIELIRNVFYEDSVKTLTADWLRYVDREGIVFARGNVIVTDRNAGSIVEGGEELEYRREGEWRPESFTVIDGGRPHATIYPSDSTEVGTAPDDPVPIDTVGTGLDDLAADPEPDSADIPLDVVADRFEITGESYFVATGNAELERGTLFGSGDEARFSHVDELLILRSNGHLRDEDSDMTIDAPQIHVRFADGGLDGLTAMGDTVRIPERIVTEEEEEEAEDIVDEDEDEAAEERVEQAAQAERVAAGDIEDLAAQMPPPAQQIVPIDPSLRARIVAQDTRMIADSVEVLTPGQQLETLIAVGQAFAERIPEDGLAPGVPEILSRDWMKGDTITAHFVPAPTATVADSIPVVEIAGVNEPDDASNDGDDPEIELERLVVSSVNGDAQAFYLRPPEEPDEGDQEAGEQAKDAEVSEQQEEEGEEPGDGSARAGPDRPGANYLIAPVITLILENSEVIAAEAVGDLWGIYVDPTVMEPTDPDGEGDPDR